MSEKLLETRNLTKKYGDFSALDNVSLTLRRSDIYGLVGRNGAGKTTFFKCVMGLAKSTAGEIEIGGRGNLNAARRNIGFMISPSFFPYLNPVQNLEYLCRVKGINRKGEVDKLLKMVGLDGVKKSFKSFSYGMKQRLGIAGALLGSPQIVVLDEPINGLDPRGIADMRNVIKDINTEQGTTFMISSHILSELDLVATTFGFIEKGRLIQEISHEELHERTKKSLIVDVDEGERARTAIHAKLGISGISVHGNRLMFEAGLDRPNEIARALVTEGIEVYRISPQETTLEEYFMRLIGGASDV